MPLLSRVESLRVTLLDLVKLGGGGSYAIRCAGDRVRVRALLPDLSCEGPQNHLEWFPSSDEGRFMHKDPRSDEELIAGLLTGEDQACEIVRQWIQHSIRIGRLGQASHPHWEDISQDVILKVITNLRGGKFASRSSLKTYVFEITKYTCVDYLRAKYRRDRVIKDDGIEDLDSVKSNALEENPYESIHRTERHKLMAEAMRRSSEDCQQLWLMIFEQSLTYRDISVLLHATEKAIKVRVFRCKKSLIQFMEELGIKGHGDVKKIET